MRTHLHMHTLSVTILTEECVQTSRFYLFLTVTLAREDGGQIDVHALLGTSLVTLDRRQPAAAGG